MAYKVVAGQGAGFSTALDAGVDAAGNAYIVGTFFGTIDFDPGPGTANLVSTGGSFDGSDPHDHYVAKYDGNGALVWARAAGSSEYAEIATAVALDASGNVFVAGSFRGSVDFDPGPGALVRQSHGTALSTFDGFLARYDSAGTVQWVVNPQASTRSDSIEDIGVDASGNVYAAGQFSGTLNFTGLPAIVAGTGTSDDEGYLAKFGADGTAIWSVTPAGPNGRAFFGGLAVDAQGNSYVTGAFQGTVDFDPGAGTTQLVSGGVLVSGDPVGQDFFLAKYSSSGQLVWVRTTGASTIDEYGTDVTLDASGNPIVTGSVLGSVDLGEDGSVDFDPGGGGVVESGIYSTYFVAKYDAAGTFQWVSAPQPSDNQSLAEGAVVDGDGNVFVSGNFVGTIDFDGGAGTQALVAQQGNLFLARYDAAGSLEWVRTTGPAPDIEVGGEAAIDASGNAYVVGYFSATVDFDPRPLASEIHVAVGDYKHFLARFTPAGLLGYPETTINSAPAAATNVTTAAFEFSSDGGTTYQAWLDGSPVTVAGDALTLTGLGQGEHSLAVRAADAYGNADATPATHVWRIDQAAPDTTLSASVGALTNRATATFDFSSDDGAATYQVSVDGGTFAAATDPLTLSGLGDGAHSLAVRAVDPAGNVDASPATFAWTIDTAPPNTTIDAGPTGATGASSATFDFSSEPGATFEARLDSGTYVSVTDPHTISGLADGVHTLRVRAVDAAGNADPTPETLVWTVDLTPPDTTISTDLAALTNRTTATFDFGPDETGTTFAATVDGTPVSVDGDMLTLSGLAEGPHTILAAATDSVGNADPTPATFVWTVDSTPPDTTIVIGPASPTGRTVAAFDFASGDGEITFETALDGSTFAAADDPTTISGFGEGPHTLLVRATDAAGNTDETPAEWVWTIDLTPPPAPAIDRFADDTGDPDDFVTSDRTLSVGGTAEPGALVHVLRDGVEVGTASADGDGEWTFADAATLAYGPHRYTAFAEDAAGNPGATSEPLDLVVADDKGMATNAADALTGNAGVNAIDGKNGDDTIFGLAANDTLKGGNGDDVLAGGGDADAIWGGNGSDRATGGNGNDTLYGEAGSDSLLGGDGRDRIEGGAGDDFVFGDGGDDVLSGGDGADTLTDGAGQDRIAGEAGADLVLLDPDGQRDTIYGTVAQLSGDTITGFVPGKSAGADVLAIAGLSPATARLLDSIMLADGVLSLAKVGGGQLALPDLAIGPHWTDTALGSDGSVLLYVV